MAAERLLNVGRTVSRAVLQPSRMRWAGGIIMIFGLGGIGAEGMQVNNEAEKIYPSISRSDLNSAEGIKTEVMMVVDEAIRQGRIRSIDGGVSIDIQHSLDLQRITSAWDLLNRSKDNAIGRTDFKRSHPLTEDSIGLKGTYGFVIGAGVWLAGGVVQLGRMFLRRKKYTPQVDPV